MCWGGRAGGGGGGRERKSEQRFFLSNKVFGKRENSNDLQGRERGGREREEDGGEGKTEGGGGGGGSRNRDRERERERERQLYQRHSTFLLQTRHPHFTTANQTRHSSLAHPYTPPPKMRSVAKFKYDTKEGVSKWGGGGERKREADRERERDRETERD